MNEKQYQAGIQFLARVRAFLKIQDESVGNKLSEVQEMIVANIDKSKFKEENFFTKIEEMGK